MGNNDFRKLNLTSCIRFFFKKWEAFSLKKRCGGNDVFTIHLMFSENAGKPDQSMSVRFSGPGNVFVLVLRRKIHLNKGHHPAEKFQL